MDSESLLLSDELKPSLLLPEKDISRKFSFIRIPINTDEQKSEIISLSHMYYAHIHDYTTPGLNLLANFRLIDFDW